MSKRGPAPDRMTDATAKSLRNIWRKVRGLIGVTNQEIADLIPGWSLQRVVHTLASGRPLRLGNAQRLQQALRDARPPELRRDDEFSRVIDALLAPIEQPSIVPPALIPVRAVPAVAAFIVRKMSRPGSGIGPKRRRVLTRTLESELRAAAEEMAQQVYELNRGGRWIDEPSAAKLLRGFGFRVPTVSGYIYEKRSRKR